MNSSVRQLKVLLAIIRMVGLEFGCVICFLTVNLGREGGREEEREGERGKG